MVGQGEKQFTEKYENATHNSSVILFAVDRWEENPIILGSGEYPPIPSQCANRQTHTERHTHLNNYIQVNHSLSNSHTHTQIPQFTDNTVETQQSIAQIPPSLKNKVIAINLIHAIKSAHACVQSKKQQHFLSQHVWKKIKEFISK